ncbi:MAG: L7Ae/L30e/S12e/Gadd45 family ribosomal protein [Desulfotomaculales bacterium]
MPSGRLSGKGGKGPPAGTGPAHIYSPGGDGGTAAAGAKLRGLLGLAARAGQVVSGTTAVRVGLTTGRVKMLVVAADAAPRTAREFELLAARYRIPVLRHGTRHELGRLLGKPPRSVVAITSEHLARGIIGGPGKGGKPAMIEKLSRR